ncbi:hypothetical protein TNIN_306291 [Trichonephila inaurata madagascariensis]|uniref:Uncharacterized protein n=1 Tax=Trichonephila inaurata madagascariensis TaxID=2747483 RepID=A0A8X6XX47_9ARAC|nr:hypothetical protein TNIN_306291 [Trichonephila inaurata madagascariensis]
MVTEGRRVTVDEIASYFNFSHDSAYQIIYDEIKFRKACVLGLPRMLTAGINILGLETMKHPLYRPDLTPLDFHLLKMVKEAFRGHFFSSVCVLTPHVPKDRKEELKKDFIEELVRQNGRHSNGLPLFTSNVLELEVFTKFLKDNLKTLFLTQEVLSF